MEFDNIKGVYTSYLANTAKEDKKNPIPQYMIEYNLLKSMKKYAVKEDEFVYVDKKYKELQEKSSKYGVEFKKL